jgi:hypothetical protein
VRPKVRQIAPLIAVSALVLCLYPLRAKKEAENRQLAQELVRPTDGDAMAPEAMPLPEEIPDEDFTESDDVLEEMTPDQQAQLAAGAEYLDGIRRIPGASPLLDDILDYLRNDGGEDLALSDLPVDDEGMIALDDPMTEKLIKNPEIKAKWDRLMALIAQNPPPKHQLRN